MKIVKFLLKAVLVIVALVVVALLALPLWFGPVVKTAANSIAPGVLKTDFHLGHLSLNPYTARFELGDMQLSNPAGYSQKYAVTLGDVAFDAETLSLVSDVIHVEEIKVKDVFVSVVSKDGVMNFKQIQYNLAGGREKYEAAQAKKESEQAAKAEQIKLQAQQKVPEKEKKAEAEKPAKKVIIDRLEISGIHLQLGFLPVAIPVTIKMQDIGRKSGGASWAEIWDQIVAEVMKAAGVAGEQLKALGNLTGDAAAQATKAMGKVTESTTKVVGQATESTTKAVGKVTESTTKAVSQATESATKVVGDGAKAVGDGAKKALDSIKSLW